MSRFAEALLPDTDAIRRQEIEWTMHKGKQLIRYCNRDGVLFRKHTADPAEAKRFFFDCLDKMHKEAQPR